MQNFFKLNIRSHIVREDSIGGVWEAAQHLLTVQQSLLWIEERIGKLGRGAGISSFRFLVITWSSLGPLVIFRNTSLAGLLASASGSSLAAFLCRS